MSWSIPELLDAERRQPSGAVPSDAAPYTPTGDPLAVWTFSIGGGVESTNVEGFTADRVPIVHGTVPVGRVVGVRLRGLIPTAEELADAAESWALALEVPPFTSPRAREAFVAVARELFPFALSIVTEDSRMLTWGVVGQAFAAAVRTLEGSGDAVA